MNKVCSEKVVSIKACQKWVHSRCSDAPRRFSLLCVISVCRGCLGNNTNDKKKEILEFKLVEVLGETNKFCHLNDMLSCYCGVSLAISARVGSTLKKGGFD